MFWFKHVLRLRFKITIIHAFTQKENIIRIRTEAKAHQAPWRTSF